MENAAKALGAGPGTETGLFRVQTLGLLRPLLELRSLLRVENTSHFRNVRSH